MGKNKVYILDTNVVLHDYNCLKKFSSADIAIPITVLEEIDDFKKGRDQLNFNAREFIRQLDILTDKRAEDRDAVFTTGVSLGEEKGNLIILSDVKYKNGFEDKFFGDKEDHHILAGAYNYKKLNPEKEVIFVTKDVNLRIKARALGIVSEDYRAGKVKDSEFEVKSNIILKDLPSDLLLELGENGVISPESIKAWYDKKIQPHNFFVLENEELSLLGRYDPFTNKIKLIKPKTIFGISAKNTEQSFAIDLLIDDRVSLITVTGSAGTGKTLLALAASLFRYKKYKQIYLSRPIVPLSNKDIGYLPGTAKNKIEPYMQPLYDNLSFIQDRFKEDDENYQIIDELQKKGKLIIAPLAYIRGRTFSNIFFIVDEAQNLTPHEVKTIVTRAGEGTKIVFTGDINQIDSPFLDRESNGLAYLMDRLKGHKLCGKVVLKVGERSVLSEVASKLL
ncbi:MAG: ribonuclease [Candidatus Cloacimonadota bacterium]|nr:MAG: ribonuclease [Candidatus Cloacimonadota bacterium]PIE78198.1 MAG: ribonuclease [Candidatus Delongbacteria bacterium]